MGKNDVKLFIADVDGTLRTRFQREAGPLTVKAFEEMRKRGIKICIASGRPLWQNVETHYKEWGMSEQFDYLIGMNGGEIWSKKDNTVRTYHQLQPADIKELLDALDSYNDVNPFLYYDRNVMLAEMDDEEMHNSAIRHDSEERICKDRSEMWSRPTGKLLFRCHTEENAYNFMMHAIDLFGDRFAIFRTGPSLVEIQYPEVSKGSGMEEVCKDLCISTDDVIAFGDAENDIEMLKRAGWSVCLKDGMDEVKQVAKYITDYNAGDDGVGHYLFDHLLNED